MDTPGLNDSNHERSDKNIIIEMMKILIIDQQDYMQNSDPPHPRNRPYMKLATLDLEFCGANMELMNVMVGCMVDGKLQKMITKNRMKTNHKDGNFQEVQGTITLTILNTFLRTSIKI